MLSDKCKKQLKKLLHERYNIVCHRIVQAQENAYNYFYFTLICSCDGKGFEMTLTVSRHMRYPTVLRMNLALEHIQPDIEGDEFIDDYDFTLHIDNKNTHLINTLSKHMYDNPVVNSINTINQKFSLGIDSKCYILYTKIIPIFGIMKKEKGCALHVHTSESQITVMLPLSVSVKPGRIRKSMASLGISKRNEPALRST